MSQRDRLREETSATRSPAGGWDPYEVWYARVHLPRLERERRTAVQLDSPTVDAKPPLARNPA